VHGAAAKFFSGRHCRSRMRLILFGSAPRPEEDQRGVRKEVHNLPSDGSARNCASALGVGCSKISSTDTFLSNSSLK
jgi:hypothetical protein